MIASPWWWMIKEKGLFSCTNQLAPVTLGLPTFATIGHEVVALDMAHSARTAITRIRPWIDGDSENGDSNAARAR
jgi:hypothetical protein